MGPAAPNGEDADVVMMMTDGSVIFADGGRCGGCKIPREGPPTAAGTWVAVGWPPAGGRGLTAPTSKVPAPQSGAWRCECAYILEQVESLFREICTTRPVDAVGGQPKASGAPVICTARCASVPSVPPDAARMSLSDGTESKVKDGSGSTDTWVNPLGSAPMAAKAEPW